MATPTPFNIEASTARLIAQMSAACPIVATSIGVPGDSTTVAFTPGASATAAQISAAQTVVTNFDWSDAATQTYLQAQEPDLQAILNQANAALTAIANYLAIPSPTAAQVTAEVAAIDQRQAAIIRALVRLALKIMNRAGVL